MLVIRFFRVGKKNQPCFKIVVTDKRNPPSGGRFIEEVGFYNPLTKEKVLKKERIKYWMSHGAKPSDTVHNLLVREGILGGAKTPVHKKPKKKSASAEAPAGKPAGKEEKKEEQLPPKELSSVPEGVAEGIKDP